VRDVGSNAFDWAMGCLMVYCALFGSGKIIFGEVAIGVCLLAVASLAGYLIFWDLSKRGWKSLSGVEEKVAAGR
jgi:SSS family solute:Na+ symporter